MYSTNPSMKFCSSIYFTVVTEWLDWSFGPVIRRAWNTVENIPWFYKELKDYLIVDSCLCVNFEQIEGLVVFAKKQCAVVSDLLVLD